MKLDSVNLKLDLGECKARADGADWFAIVFKNSQAEVAKIYPGDITRRDGEYYVNFSAREYRAFEECGEECRRTVHFDLRNMKKITGGTQIKKIPPAV